MDLIFCLDFQTMLVNRILINTGEQTRGWDFVQALVTKIHERKS